MAWKEVVLGLAKKKGVEWTGEWPESRLYVTKHELTEGA